VSSPIGVRGGAPAENDFGAFWGARTALVAILVAKFCIFLATLEAERSPACM